MIWTILKNEKILSRFFSNIGFIYLSGIFTAQIIYSTSGENEGFQSVILVVFCMAILILAIVYSSLHVVRPCVQLKWTDFEIPPLPKTKKSIKEVLSRTDFKIFTLFSCLFASFGVLVFIIAFVHSYN